ncbi:Ribose-phosphate pyrophosphokinase 4-like protein [Drosera capensis]
MTTEKKKKYNPMEKEKEKEKEKPKLKKKVLLFYCEEAKDLAIKVADESDNITLQSINWGDCADGFPKIQINNPQAIRGQNVAFLASFSKPDVIFEQMSVIYMFALHSAASFTLVLPFFPTTTTSSMDQDEEIEVQTAYAVARILSSIPLSGGRPTDLVTYDIRYSQDFGRHFGDHIRPIRLLTGIGLLMPQLRLLPGYSNSKDSNMVAVAFPHYVAHDAFHKRFTEFPVELLTLNGAKEISAYVTHAVFLNRSWKWFLHNDDACNILEATRRMGLETLQLQTMRGSEFATAFGLTTEGPRKSSMPCESK